MGWGPDSFAVAYPHYQQAREIALRGIDTFSTSAHDWPLETAATTLFALVFLFALTKAFLHIRGREIAQHREWMIRAFAIGLAVATIRPIVGLFFAFSRITHQTPREFFGIAFWIGFTLHLIAAEAWINYTRPRLGVPVTT